MARAHLERLGFRVIARNVHLRHAELDLVALAGTTLCFVEVRLRSSDRFGSAAASVDARKQQRIRRAAAEFLSTHQIPRHRAVRFDVVAIDLQEESPIRVIRDAFQR